MTTEYLSGPQQTPPVTDPTATAPAGNNTPWENPDEEGDDELPDWMQGSGVDNDMTDPAKAGGGQGGLRFWLPKSSQKIIVFLTDGSGKEGPPVIFEHNVPIGSGKKRWQNWFSCLEPLGMKCPLCQFAEMNDGVGRRYKGMFFTVIDTTEFTDKSGNKRSNLRKLLCAKKDTSEILARKYLSRIEASERLRGAMFKVYRKSSDKSPSVGDDFEYMKMVDLNALPDATQLNYIELLKPDPDKVHAAFERMKAEREAFGKNPDDFKAPQEGAGAKVNY